MKSIKNCFNNWFFNDIWFAGEAVNIFGQDVRKKKFYKGILSLLLSLVMIVIVKMIYKDSDLSNWNLVHYIIALLIPAIIASYGAILSIFGILPFINSFQPYKLIGVYTFDKAIVAGKRFKFIVPARDVEQVTFLRNFASYHDIMAYLVKNKDNFEYRSYDDNAKTIYASYYLISVSSEFIKQLSFDEEDDDNEDIF